MGAEIRHFLDWHDFQIFPHPRACMSRLPSRLSPMARKGISRISQKCQLHAMHCRHCHEARGRLSSSLLLLGNEDKHSRSCGLGPRRNHAVTGYVFEQRMGYDDTSYNVGSK